MSTRAGLVLLLALLFNMDATAAQASQWTIPDGSKPNFTDVYNNGNSVTWSWQGLNQSMSDLWLTRFDSTNSYAVRIAANINITGPGTLPWTITVNETEIDIDDSFCLRFVLTGTDVFPLQADQFPSPAFIILQRGEVAPASTVLINAASSSPVPSITSLVTPPTGVPPTSTAAGPSNVSSATVPLAAATTSAAASSPSNHSSGLSAGAKAGIAIAVTAVFVIIIALSFWVMRLYRRIQAASNHHSWGIIPETAGAPPSADSLSTPTVKKISGLHEVLGDRRQPTEMDSKEENTVIHEMAG
jgi:hypothetical protein